MLASRELYSLPVRVEYKGDEMPTSYVARISHAHGFKTLADFCTLTGLNRLRLRAGGQYEVQRLARWTNIVPDHLSQFAFRSGGRVAFGNALVHRHRLATTGMRYCVTCLASDFAPAAEKPYRHLYLRASWHWNAVTHCPEHGTLLIHDRDASKYRDDTAAWMREARPLMKEKASTVRDISCDRHFASRIVGKSEPHFLDRFEAYVAAELCETLGTMEVGNGRVPEDKALDNDDLLFAARKLGFEVVSEGFDAINSFMSDYVKRKVRSVWEHRRIYSPIWFWLRHQAGDRDYSELVDLFQDHAEQHVPFAKGEIFLKPVKSRTLHTLKSAAREYGVPESRVETLLRAAGVALPSLEATPYLSRELTDRILAVEQEFVTTSQAAKMLGCSAAVLEVLLDQGLLEFKLNNPGVPRPFRRIARSEIQRFLDIIMQGAKTEPGFLRNLVSMRAAAARCHCQVTEIIALICQGKLSYVGRKQEQSLASLMVDPDEIAKHVELSEADGFLDMRGVERMLRTTTATVSELVKRDLLPITLRRHPTKRNLQRYVDTGAVKHFLGKYVSLSIIARERHYQIAFLRDLIEAKGVRPIFEPANKIARFYRRAEISGLL
jgi:hypothetical protein